MKLGLILIFLLTQPVNAYAISFKKSIEKLKAHELVEEMKSNSKAQIEEGNFKGSWGDPEFKIAAKNFPVDTLKSNQTPMTGIEFGISQNIALTTKYGNEKKSFYSLSKAMTFLAKDKEIFLVKSFWINLILKRQILEEKKILEENQSWIKNNVEVSKKLYANGKISQQALLDLQIRKSEIEILIINKSYESSRMDDMIAYLVGEKEIDEGTIPWSLLLGETGKKEDYKELSLKELVTSKEYNLVASKLNYISDVKISVSITKRSDIDGNGDFIGAQISFPLPFSDEKGAKYSQSVHHKYSAVKKYENYKRLKKRNISLLKKEINKLKSELDILLKKTIRFAQNSRAITSKSYGLGNSRYVELLQSELKLQKILLHKVELEAARDIKIVNLRYTLGEPLHE